MAEEKTKKAAEQPVQATSRPRLSREEIIERKVKLAQERNVLQMRGNSPLGYTMHHILRQFDQAYARFKGDLGEPGGIPHEEGEKLMAEGHDILERFNAFTAKLSRRVKFDYRPPRVLETEKSG